MESLKWLYSKLLSRHFVRNSSLLAVTHDTREVGCDKKKKNTL